MLMPIMKEIIFLIGLVTICILMIINNNYYINNILLVNIVFFVVLAGLISLWNIPGEEYLLYLYRKVQYIYVMFLPLSIYCETKNKKIFNIMNVAMLLFLLFLMFNLIFNVSELKFGKFSGLFLSRPGAGFLALVAFIYYYYIYDNKLTNGYFFYISFILSFIIALCYIVFTGSKTAGFSLAVLAFIFLINHFKLNLKKVMIFLFVITLIFSMVPISYFNDIVKFGGGTELSSSIQRYIEWRIAIDIIGENWICGVGWKEYGELINSNVLKYGKELFPHIQWGYIYDLNGDSSSQNVILDNMAIFGIFGWLYNTFLVFVLIKVFKIEGVKGYILPVLLIILLVNNFNFGNGYEVCFWFLIGIVLLNKKYSNNINIVE